MKKRVNLRDIAAKAGVHVTTVSLALRGHPRITLPVRQRIQELAREMGYVPDPMLAALNAYRKSTRPAHYQATLAWVNNWPRPRELRIETTFNEYFLGAQERAEQLGYKLEEIRLRERGMNPERASRILKSRGIEGLLLAPQYQSGTDLELDYDAFSAVTFGYSLFPRRFHLVTNHHAHSVQTALEKMAAAGYRRIGLCMGSNVDAKVDHGYLSGYWLFHHLHPELEAIPPSLIPPENRDLIYFADWFAAHEPDAILTSGRWDIPAWLKKAGRKVPEQVGFARLSIAREETHDSGVYENGLQIGRAAVDMLVGTLQRGEKGVPQHPLRLLVEGEWKGGETLRSLPKN